MVKRGRDDPCSSPVEVRQSIVLLYWWSVAYSGVAATVWLVNERYFSHVKRTPKHQILFARIARGSHRRESALDNRNNPSSSTTCIPEQRLACRKLFCSLSLSDSARVPVHVVLFKINLNSAFVFSMQQGGWESFYGSPGCVAPHWVTFTGEGRTC